jgi:hypothetical protein
VVGSCEHVNVPFGSEKCGEFLELLSDCLLLKNGSAPWSYLVRYLSC